MYKITVKSFFSAAHHLRNYKGNCENVHGHNWKVVVTAKYKELPDNGMAIDFRDLKNITDDVIDTLDHVDINTIDYFQQYNPTSENIAKYIYDEIKKRGIPVADVTVFETEKYSATYSEDTD